MSETPTTTQPRHSLFERMRGPMTLLMIAVGGCALYYSLFFERKTSYFRDRNARLVSTVADQVRRSIGSTAWIVSNAATMSEEELKELYQFRRISEDQRQPQAMFDELKLHTVDEKTGHEQRRYAQHADGGLKLLFEGKSVEDTAGTPAVLSSAAGKEPSWPKRYVSASIPLARLINTTVTQTIGDAFDTVFILDSGGNVIYQSVRHDEDESEANVKIVRIKELRVHKWFQADTTLQVDDLMSASRQIPVQIGDTSYQLFSIPFPSAIAVEGSTEAGGRSDLWVICGVVSNAEFRSRSLALSVTILSYLAAAFLLTVFAWPFVKMAMASAQHKVTLVDVILLGVSGILAASIVCLAVIDGFTYHKLEATADGQLETLAGRISTNFRGEISTVMRQLDAVQLWAEDQIRQGAAKPRNSDLLASSIPGVDRPYFQSVSLIDGKGRQKVKWSVDHLATPLIRVNERRYYAASDKRGRDYLLLDGRRIAIDSIRSTTTPQPEVVFARRTDDTRLESTAAFQKQFPVIAMSMPSALSIINPVLPRHFGFAVVDQGGSVLFHSDSHRNTVENFFAETDDDPRVKAAVEARQNESLNIRYWGEDYRAYIQPMKDLPWTLITFREKNPLRTLNTDALTITLIFLLILFGAGFVAFIALVLLVRPRYRAPWIWPDPARVKTYVELSGVYLGLLTVAAMLFLTLHDGALLAFPFWFVPLVLMITYLYLRASLCGPKRLAATAFAATLASGLLLLMWRGRSSGWAAAAMIAAAALIAAIVVRAVQRPDDAGDSERLRERQTALPLCYVGAAFLGLFVISAVPTAAFFKSAFEMETESYVKWLQMKLADDLQSRWWRVSAELSADRGQGKVDYFFRRWEDRNDLYADAVYDTKVDLSPDPPQEPSHLLTAAAFPDLVDVLIPRFSDASVKTRELVHDRASDDLWWWTSRGSRVDLMMRNREPVRRFTISSAVPALLPTFRNATLPEVGRMLRPGNLAAAAVALLLILGVTFAIARFIARRVFLVDVVNPLWLSQGFLGLRHVLCHPCDAASALRLFRDFKWIDLSKEADLELARTAPQSFKTFEPSVFINNIDYEFATGESSKLVRDLIERLTRNADRTIVLRPTAMNVITASFLQNDDSESWARTLSTFTWVTGSQLMTADKRLTFSGTVPLPNVEPATGMNRWRWPSLRGLYVLSGFDVYFEQFSDTQTAIERALATETQADPYLCSLMTGLGTHASGLEQLLDEISERAEDYYNVLWRTCTPNEQLVLMQIAQTGLANGKTRKDVRRLLARGLLRRDPQLGLMNETFRRFVFGQCTTSALAQQLEQNLSGDAWNRFRVPFFAAIAVVMLFFFTTQRQTFDATIALVGGLTAGLPTFLKTLSGLGQRSGAKAG